MLQILLKARRKPLSTPVLRSPDPHFAPLFAAFSTSEAPSPPPGQGKEDRGIWSKLLLFVPGAAAFGLGTWQITRRQEKIEMLEYRKKRLEKEPILLNTVSSSEEDLSKLEFRKVLVEGAFDEKKSIYIGPRSRTISGVTENGYFVITPLIPTSGDAGRVQLPILVNRGWVPRDWRNKSMKDDQDSEVSPPSTKDMDEKPYRVWWKFWSPNHKPTESNAHDPSLRTVKVVGVIRGSEKPSIFVPDNCPRTHQWFYVDVPMMARECGLPENTIYIEDIDEHASASNPYPVPRDANALINFSVMPRDHLNYILTWYTLSGAVTFMAFKRIRASKSRR